MSRHRHFDPLKDPGGADLTAHVDFAAFGQAAAASGARVWGPVTQGDFLKALGLAERARKLSAGKPANEAQAIEAACRRLIEPAQMGSLFKALALDPSVLARARGIWIMIELASLSLPGIRHGFFTRAGGVSAGVYASLNCGFGAKDEAARVSENRARAMKSLGVAPSALATAKQVHGAEAVVVEKPWPEDQAPRADALVTRVPGSRSGS